MLFSSLLKYLLPLLLLTASAIVFYVLSRKNRTLKIRIVSIILLACFAVGFLGILVPAVAPYLGKYEFSSQPMILEAYDGYSIIWATSKKANGVVEVLDATGKTTIYTDSQDGVGVFNSRIHRVFIPRDELNREGVSYRVKSRRTIDTEHYSYFLGDELVGDYYTPILNDRTPDEVSCLVISDVQGADKYIARAIEKDSSAYDFVLLLGDYSNDYNTEEDMISPLIVPAAMASGSVLPCLYVTGNHELKGNIRTEINRLFNTPSPTNKRYYTWSYGKLHATVLDLGDDHDDGMERYNGASYCDAYRDEQYSWLQSVQADTEEYSAYEYNVCFVHIPLIVWDNQYIRDRVCKECGHAHGYKQAEIQEVLTQMDIDIMISAHTHIPRLVRAEGCAFPNLQTGAKENSAGSITGYTLTHIVFADGKMTYTNTFTNGDVVTDTITL